MGTERQSKRSPSERTSSADSEHRKRPPPPFSFDIIGLQHTIGNQQVSRLLASEPRSLQREVIDNYSYWIKKPLSRSWKDWAITDKDCLKAIGQLLDLSDGDLLDTYNQMQADGLWATLSEQAPKHAKPWHDVQWRLVRLGQPVMGKSSEDKRLAQLQSSLSTSERAIRAAEVVTQDPKLRAQMVKAADQFGLAAGTLGKGLTVVSAAKAIHKLSNAAAVLNSIDIREDADAAAAAFGKLLSAGGELGKLLPPGPWTPYFDFLTGFDDFFSNMRRKMDPRNRGGGRYREYMPR